jgi:2-dehydro-3-deoxygluconokinase
MGEPMLEFNQQPADPDGRVHFLQGHGGDTSNVAIAAARSGARVGYVTAVGEDAGGEAFLELWRREGVDATTVQTNPQAPTGIYFVTHNERGHHFTFYRTGSAAARYTSADLPVEAIQAAKVLHVSGISQAISETACDSVFAAIEAARAAGVQVSYDTNLRLRLWPAQRAAAVMHAAIARSDLVFPSLEDAEVLTGLHEADAIADFYLEFCPTVLLKLGKDGVLVCTREKRERLLGHQVQAVDATGAGDTFAGAFLARHVAGEGPFEAARYANAAAALSTTGYGAVAPIPSAADIRALLTAP